MANPGFTSRATLGEIVQMINEGRPDDAAAACRVAIDRQPADVNMVALLGAILIKARQFETAEKYLRQAIELAPTFAKPHEDLGFLLLQTDQAQEAVVVLERATRLDPEVDSAHFTLGKALAACGRGSEADAAFERSFDLSPIRKTMALAAEHHRAGDFAAAERLYRQVLKREPDHVDALRLLGMIAFAAGRHEDAETLLRRAVAAAPDFVGALVDLARILQERNQLPEAIDFFARAAELSPANPQVHFLLAGAYAPAGRSEAAIGAFNKAIELRPNHAGAWLGLGHVLKTVGQQAEAIHAYRQCIQARPDNGEAYWSLANLKTYTLGDEDIKAMQVALAADEKVEQSEVNMLFAIAKAFEDRKDYPTAWSYYSQGNRKRRMQENYDPVQTEVLHDQILSVFTPVLFEKHAGSGCPDPSPVFVLGLPRSGSTLLEQILASHSQVEGTSELPYLGRVATSLNRNRADGLKYPELVAELESRHFKPLGEDYLARARSHRLEGTPRFIDKMPNNFPNIGFLKLILPNAKIIDARRHPMDACLGCYRQLFAQGQTFTYDLIEIGEYFLEYQRMMDYWHAALPGSVLTVQYEAVVFDLENQVRRLLDFCELAFEQQCVDFHETARPVRTASSEQVRKPIYTGAVGFWRNYEPYLDELKAVLEPVLPRYQAFQR
jgi:tetratricopeptide (TPR) repeat protein